MPFAEKLIGGSFPEEGWWALVRRLEHISRPDYLSAGHDFCESGGETMRLTDEIAGALSPLHRERLDLSPMAYHGIRMIAEDRSRFAIRPFETAQGKLLLEVRPDTAFQRLGVPPGSNKPKDLKTVIETLATMEHLSVDFPQPYLGIAGRSRGALDSVLAARCTAVAVTGGEADRTPESLAPNQSDRVRHEGWIYGLDN